MRALVEHFVGLEDPRVERRQRHALVSVVTMALCGVIGGAESWVAIEQFGQAKADWLAAFLDRPNGIPSQDPFGRVFARLDAGPFAAGFAAWRPAAAEALPLEGSALDGKTLGRPGQRQSRTASGQRLGERQSAGPGPGGDGREVPRDHCLSAAAAPTGSGRLSGNQ